MVGTSHGEHKAASFECKCKRPDCKCKTTVSLDLYDGVCSYCQHGMHVDAEGRDLG